MGETVTYPTSGGIGQGYLALPSGTGSTTGAPPPAVLVLQEWWTSDPQIRSVADRFAAEGFVALVPDLYHGIRAAEPSEAGRLLMGLAMDRAADELAAAADHLATRPGGSARAGAVGFRLGGSLALWSATRSERIVAAVGWYPVLPWERMPASWDGYRGSSALVHRPEFGGPAGAAVREVAHAIEAAGGDCVEHAYPGTRGAFFNDDRPRSYHEEAATLGWARSLELLRRRLTDRYPVDRRDRPAPDAYPARGAA